ncbi:MAG: hypothetical protein HKN62_00590 [Phycisphaerales bacterium]|nr:hypothetical protein [Phycisphaerales bacterium]
MATITAAVAGQTPASPDRPSGPDPAAAVGAFLTVEQWVREFQTPAPADPASLVPVDGASGVMVMLRHRGRLLGTGINLSGDALMVRRAAGRALTSVLGDPTVANLPEDQRARVGRTLTLELAFSGPMIALPGRTFSDVAMQLAPGLDGVAMRRGESLQVLFPSQIRQQNIADRLTRRLPALAADLGLPAAPLPELTQRFGVRLYRFRTLDLTQRAPGRRPMETFRGETLVRIDEIDADRIATLASGLTDHIITSLWGRDEPFGLMGDYRPALDRYEPLLASPRDQALCVYALGRYAGVDGLPASEADRARTAASVILTELAATVEGEPPPLPDLSTAAVIVLAANLGIDVDPAVTEPLLSQAAAEVDGVIDEADLSTHGTHTLALATHAAAVRSSAPGGPDATAVAAFVDRVWTRTPPGERLSLLPWIGWAEDLLRRAGHDRTQRVTDLRTLRTVLEAIRVAPDPATADLRGGFQLGRGPAASVTAQSARPAAYLATMLGDPIFTPPGGRPALDTRHRETMRYLVQLSVEDRLLWRIRNPNRALGGLRAATWDIDQPVAAQAIGLLAASETLRQWRREP